MGAGFAEPIHCHTCANLKKMSMRAARKPGNIGLSAAEKKSTRQCGRDRERFTRERGNSGRTSAAAAATLVVVSGTTKLTESRCRCDMPPGDERYGGAIDVRHHSIAQKVWGANLSGLGDMPSKSPATHLEQREIRCRQNEFGSPACHAEHRGRPVAMHRADASEVGQGCKRKDAFERVTIEHRALLRLWIHPLGITIEQMTIELRRRSVHGEFLRLHSKTSRLFVFVFLQLTQSKTRTNFGKKAMRKLAILFVDCLKFFVEKKEKHKKNTKNNNHQPQNYYSL